jgi:hypothetical protein
LGAGEADVLVTNEGDALGNTNAAAQSSAFAASETAAAFLGVNPFANAASIVAGTTALSFGLTALAKDLIGGKASGSYGDSALNSRRVCSRLRLFPPESERERHYGLLSLALEVDEPVIGASIRPVESQ